MTARSVATVIGGDGFLGRYVVKRLAARGYVVRVCSRHPANGNALRPMGRVGQVVPLYASLGDAGTLERAVAGAEVVVNLVGILAEQRRGDFTRVHAEGAERLARAAAAAGVRRLIHMSAIGADRASPSAYGRSKAQGEVAVRDAFPNAAILRPSLVFGPEDAFFNRFASMARFSPVMPVFYGATRMQPVYVGDVADAVLRLVEAPHDADFSEAPWQLGGPRVWTFREILAWILNEIRRPLPLVGVPSGLAGLQASVLERLPGRLLTRDQLRMLAQDNVVSPGAPDLVSLDIVPTPVELVVPEYLHRYRPGGGKREILK